MREEIKYLHSNKLIERAFHNFERRGLRDQVIELMVDLYEMGSEELHKTKAFKASQMRPLKAQLRSRPQLVEGFLYATAYVHMCHLDKGFKEKVVDYRHLLNAMIRGYRTGRFCIARTWRRYANTLIFEGRGDIIIHRKEYRNFILGVARMEAEELTGQIDRAEEVLQGEIFEEYFKEHLRESKRF